MVNPTTNPTFEGKDDEEEGEPVELRGLGEGKKKRRREEDVVSVREREKARQLRRSILTSS